MALRSILSTIARVEIALALLIVILFAFTIEESDDVWALALSSVVLAAAPVAALLLSRSNTNYRMILAAVLIASWLPTVWWLLTYA